MTKSHNILISYGWQKYFPVEILQQANANIFYFADAFLPFNVVSCDNSGSVIHIDNAPILKNGKAAIPYIRGYKDKDGNIKPIYLTEEDKILGINEIDLFIPFTAAETYNHHQKLFKFIEHHQIPSVETSMGIAACMNKINTYRILTKAGISMPKSLALPYKNSYAGHEQAFNFFKEHSKKILLKKNISYVGKDIYIPKNKQELTEGINQIFEQGSDILIQEKIDIPPPLHHLRVAVAYDEIIASQKFISDSYHPTSHVGKHAKVEDITLTPEQEKTCLQAVKTLGVNLCSIDCLISITGDFYILELNVMPAIKHWFPEQPKKMVEKIIERYF